MVFDFDHDLPPEKQLRVHRTKLCKRYLMERARVERLAAKTLMRGGTLSDPVLLTEIASLDRLGLALRARMQELEKK